MKTRYSISTEIRHDPLELIDIPAIVDAVTEEWHNQTLTRVNESVVRLGVIKGEFHWHKHQDEDEFFCVLEGKLLLDLEDRTVELGPHQGFTVPRGVMHRTRAPEKVIVMMVASTGVIPTGD